MFSDVREQSVRSEGLARVRVLTARIFSSQPFSRPSTMLPTNKLYLSPPPPPAPGAGPPGEADPPIVGVVYCCCGTGGKLAGRGKLGAAP